MEKTYKNQGEYVSDLLREFNEVIKTNYSASNLIVTYEELQNTITSIKSNINEAKDSNSNKLRDAQNKFHKHGKRW